MEVLWRCYGGAMEGLWRCYGGSAYHDPPIVNTVNPFMPGVLHTGRFTVVRIALTTPATLSAENG